MMAEHFPEGLGNHSRAEEVTEGFRTLKIDRSKTAEISPEVPSDLLKIAKFGARPAGARRMSSRSRSAA